MIDPAFCIFIAFLVFCGVLGIYGIVCCIAQCVRHCKKDLEGITQ